MLAACGGSPPPATDASIDATPSDTQTADLSAFDSGEADTGRDMSHDPGCESGLDGDDMELAELINDYRESQGLPRVPVSVSLSVVARTHVADLSAEAPNQGTCNLHSWSDAGDWTACCYTPDHAQAQCMWDKPRELSAYPGNGYEISVGGVRSAAAALAAWQSSSGHHEVILNQGIWTEPWGAMGVALTPGEYGHVWFGRESDPARCL